MDTEPSHPPGEAGEARETHVAAALNSRRMATRGRYRTRGKAVRTPATPSPRRLKSGLGFLSLEEGTGNFILVMKSPVPA